MVSLAERRLLGEYLDRQTVMARVEANIESNMQTVLNDWGLYQAAKEKRSGERRELTGGN